MTKTDDARFVILQNGFMSAGACGVFKALVPIPWLEIGALTWATRHMCNRVVQIYGYEDLPGMERLIGKVIRSATEAKLVYGLLDVIPGFNIGTNAVATFTLQSVSGIIITSICELLDEKAIHRDFIENITAERISELLATVTAVVGEFARGNDQASIQIVKEEFCTSLVEFDDMGRINGVEDYIEAEIQECLLLATANAAEEIADDMGLIVDSSADEQRGEEYSVADVLGYNDFVKHVYATYLDSLQPDQLQDDIIAAAGKTYRRIYERNCQEGLWSKKQGFDDTLAYYVAGYVKEKSTCHCLTDISKESLAYELSRCLKADMA